MASKTLKEIPSEYIIRPIQKFANMEASGGIVLIVTTALALILANSPLSSEYVKLLNTQFTLILGKNTLSLPIILWINDGLMTFFFLVVGLEIKREILEGELNSAKQAALPIAAAVGGMTVPALIFTLINLGSAGAHGWGIPMATDIAFSLGVLTLLGKRIPLGLKAFVVALAIVDDMGAVIVISLFYTSSLSVNALLAGLIVIIAIFIVNRLSVRNPIPYFILGAVLWLAFLNSGIHASLAGVLLAILIPSHSGLNTEEFISQKQSLLDKLRPSIKTKALSYEDYQKTMSEINELDKNFEAPMHRLERILLPWTTFLIVPLFAFANAGVVIKNNLLSSLTSPLTFGVIAGLILGKQIGITTFSWLAIKTGIATLPKEVSLKQIYGASWLCGIGFTMSLFITNLSFTQSSLITDAKIGILTASIIAGLVGYFILKRKEPIIS